MQKNYMEIVKGIEDGLLKVKVNNVPLEEFKEKLNYFKNFNYKQLTDAEVYFTLIKIMFFNMGKKASMIEKKVPLFKKYIYDYKKVAMLSDQQVEEIIQNIGFGQKIYWCRENAVRYKRIIDFYGSFDKYISKRFDINDTKCSIAHVQKLRDEIKSYFIGIGETASWHFVTELGFFSLKPDSVIRRIFYRLGLINNMEDMNESINVGRAISEELNIPIRYIDIIFVKFGQEGRSDLIGTTDGICTSENPKCTICTLHKFCKYFKGEIEVHQIVVNHKDSITVGNKLKATKPLSNLANTGIMEKFHYEEVSFYKINYEEADRSKDNNLFTPEEFLASTYFRNMDIKARGLFKHLILKLQDLRIMYYIQKRKNNDFIFIAKNRLYAKTRKNICTVWVYNTGIDVRVMPDPQKKYTNSDELDRVIDKVYRKYNELIEI